MHLAIYTNTLKATRGAERVVANIASGLAAKGHLVDILIEEEEGALLADLVREPGVTLVSLNESGWDRVFSRLLQVWVNLCNLVVGLAALESPKQAAVLGLARLSAKRRPPLHSLLRYVKTDQPEVVLSFLNYPNIALLMASQLYAGETRFVVNVRNHVTTSARQGKSKWIRSVPGLMRRFFPSADGVLAPSNGVAEDVAQITGLSRRAIQVVPNPVFRSKLLELAKQSAPHPWLAEPGPPVILGAGKLRPQKDFPTLIRAFALLRERQDVRLIILGEGSGREELMETARSHGVADAIAFPGHVENPYAWYRRAAVFVLSSAWEGLPNALIEAMACGCPVVSTDCPSGPREILKEGKFGPLVPVGDAPALAGAIAATLADPAAPELLVERARYFSLENAVASYEEALKRVALEA